MKKATPLSEKPISAELQQLCDDFHHWRSQRKLPKEPIPEDLLRRAYEQTQVTAISVVLKVLSLNYQQFKRLPGIVLHKKSRRHTIHQPVHSSPFSPTEQRPQQHEQTPTFIQLPQAENSPKETIKQIPYTTIEFQGTSGPIRISSSDTAMLMTLINHFMRGAPC